jgi:hypothetical protein
VSEKSMIFRDYSKIIEQGFCFGSGRFVNYLKLLGRSK